MAVVPAIDQAITFSLRAVITTARGRSSPDTSSCATRRSKRVRLDVEPELTGPMQVYGRSELSLEERIAVERDYIENMSLRRDQHARNDG
jgi:lipopolysaccharide/colanic/teichoic acid biosynthesis glycosyltransferase